MCPVCLPVRQLLHQLNWHALAVSVTLPVDGGLLRLVTVFHCEFITWSVTVKRSWSRAMHCNSLAAGAVLPSQLPRAFSWIQSHQRLGGGGGASQGWPPTPRLQALPQWLLQPVNRNEYTNCTSCCELPCVATRKKHESVTLY